MRYHMFERASRPGCEKRWQNVLPTTLEHTVKRFDSQRAISILQSL